MISAEYFVISCKPRLREALSDPAFDFLLDPRLWSMMQGLPDYSPRELKVLHLARFRIAYRSALAESPGSVPPIPLSELVFSNFDQFWTLESLGDPEEYEHTVMRIDEGELLDVADAETVREMKRVAQERQPPPSTKQRFRV